MDKYKITQIICWLIVFLVLVGMVIWFVLGNRSGFSHVGFQMQNLGGPFNEIGRYDVDITDIDSLNINWISGDITVTPYTGSQIELVEYAQRKLKDDEVMVYNKDKNKLTVKFCKDNKHIINYMPPKKLEVFVPADLAGKLHNFIIDNVSSSVNVSDITADYFEVGCVSGESYIKGVKAQEIIMNSTSGNMDLKDINAPKTSFDTISGEIYITGQTSDELSVNTTSGDMTIKDTSTKKLSVDTTSGETSFNGSFENLKANTTSGDIEMTNIIAPQSFDIDSVSGEVTLTVPEFDGFNLKQDSVSGEFNCDIPVQLNNKESTSFRINTTSGDISIKKYK